MAWFQRSSTQDRSDVPERARFYTTLQLGEKRSLTPEGFLLCEDVPIARVGQMIYGPDETPIDDAGRGNVLIDRDADEVFRPETLASFNGKPIVNDHPDEDVTPANWRELSGGSIINPRRGTGEDEDLLLADLLVCAPEFIKAIQEQGKTEVSCGYDADYVPTGPGRGKQTNILGNHVALVDRGRCGPRCSIGDHLSTNESGRGNQPMANKSLRNILARMRRAARDNDQEALMRAINEGQNAIGDEDLPDDEGAEGSETHVHVHLNGEGKPDTSADPAADTRVLDDDTEARLSALEEGHQVLNGKLDQLIEMMNQDLSQGADAAGDIPDETGGDMEGKITDEEIEGQLEEEAPEGTGDRARKARDSAYLQDSYQETASMAETLVPGVRIPTFDRSANPKQTFRTLCNFRRSVLDAAYRQPDTQEIISALNGGRNLNTRSMTCDSVRTLFRGAAAMKGQRNRDAGLVNGVYGPGAGTGVRGRIKTLADVNRENAEHYKVQQ